MSETILADPDETKSTCPTCAPPKGDGHGAIKGAVLVFMGEEHPLWRDCPDCMPRQEPSDD